LKILICLLFHTLILANDSRSLYALLCYDTISNVKGATYNDQKHIHEALWTINKELQAHITIKTLQGQNLTSKTLSKSMKKIPKSDILLFYFSGHGFRPEISSLLFPYIILPAKHERYSAELICRQLEHSACLVLLIFDCCNCSRPPPEFLRTKSLSPSLPGLYSLFNKQGSVIFIGAVPGTPSLAYSNGSLFTTVFLNTLLFSCQNEHVSWEDIYEKTAQLCLLKDQKPLCFINLK